MQVDRFYRVTAGEMNAVKALGQTEEVLVVLAIPDAASSIKIRYVRRTRHLSEGSVGASEYQGMIRISRL